MTTLQTYSPTEPTAIIPHVDLSRIPKRDWQALLDMNTKDRFGRMEVELNGQAAREYIRHVESVLNPAIKAHYVHYKYYRELLDKSTEDARKVLVLADALLLAERESQEQARIQQQEEQQRAADEEYARLKAESPFDVEEEAPVVYIPPPAKTGGSTKIVNNPENFEIEDIRKFLKYVSETDDPTVVEIMKNIEKAVNRTLIKKLLKTQDIPGIKVKRGKRVQW